VVALSGRAAAQGPTIEITDVPPFGTIANLRGQVAHAALAEYHVAAYLFLEGLGWYVKPSLAVPCTPLSASGDFEIDVTTGGYDEWATRLAVFLLPIAEPCPAAFGDEFLADALLTRPSDLVERSGLAAAFSFSIWPLRDSRYFGGPRAPGDLASNCFSPDNVFRQGTELHLALRSVPGLGQCGAEAVLPRSLGYGQYRIHTRGRLDTLDPRTVFGIFLWDPDAKPAHRELDIEFSRWGDGADPLNAQFVVQPFGATGNRDRFTVGSTEADLTLLMDWSPGTVTMAAFRGHHFGVPPEADLVHRHTFPSGVPEPGRERVRLNLWRYCPAACDSMPDQEVVVTHFSHVPAPRRFHTLTPCRLVDTREPNGRQGGPPLVTGNHRSFRVARDCGIPDTARSLSLNVTVAQPALGGHVLLYALGDSNVLLASTINYVANQTRANNAVVNVGDGGQIAAIAGSALGEVGFVHLIVDVNGYFE
jgi:hypothetical protein